MIIGCDLDDVLARTSEAWYSSLLELFPEFMNGYGMGYERFVSEFYHPARKHTQEEKELFRTPFKQLDFLLSLEPYEENIVSLKSLALRHKIFIISAPLSDTETTIWYKSLGPKAEWIDRYLTPEITSKNLIIAKEKWPLLFGLDIMIDDADNNFLLPNYVSQQKERANCFLIDRPWNQGCELGKIQRIRSLQYFTDL